MGRKVGGNGRQGRRDEEAGSTVRRSERERGCEDVTETWSREENRKQGWAA